MSVKHLVLTPGDFLARRFDGGYAKFVRQIKRETREGNRRLAIYSFLARAECVLAFAVGASASYFGFVAVVPLVLRVYPLIALGDRSRGVRFVRPRDRLAQAGPFSIAGMRAAE